MPKWIYRSYNLTIIEKKLTDHGFRKKEYISFNPLRPGFTIDIPILSLILQSVRK